MSLSKYYKNSPSFQPEDLVKQPANSQEGWTPAPRSDNQPFQKQLPPAQTQTYTRPAPPLSRTLPESGQPRPIPSPQPASTNPPDISAPWPPEETSVDLSKYIEITVADKKANDAYQLGQTEARDKAEQDFAATTQAMVLVCQQLNTLRETIIGNSKTELLDFILAITERILRLSLREQDHTIVATIEEALRRAVKSDEFTIYIHPDDYDILSEKAGEIIAGLSGLNNVVLRKDHTIERGGASIESDNCTVDATIASQFDIIREEVKKQLQ